MRRKIVAGNWKMNLNNQEGRQLAIEIASMTRDGIKDDVIIMLAPPVIYLNHLRHLIDSGNKDILVGAQNCSAFTSGAYTGEVSASMIESSGGSFVIVGHSERRLHFQETNEVIAQKVQRVLECNMQVIYCCGESKQEREKDLHFSTVTSQIEEGLFHIPASEAKGLIIAYEPVWAIGTGLTATPSQAQEMHQFIRKLLTKKYGGLSKDISVIYGGSCNEKNAAELFALPDIDGGLIGGASLKASSFVSIIKSMS